MVYIIFKIGMTQLKANVIRMIEIKKAYRY